MEVKKVTKNKKIWRKKNRTLTIVGVRWNFWLAGLGLEQIGGALGDGS